MEGEEEEAVASIAVIAAAVAPLISNHRRQPEVDSAPILALVEHAVEQPEAEEEEEEEEDGEVRIRVVEGEEEQLKREEVSCCCWFK